MKKLNTIHHQCLQLVLGSYASSPVESLYAKSHKLPLALRQHKLALQYYIKRCSCPSKSAYNCVLQPQYKELYNLKETAIKLLGICIESNINKVKIKNALIHETILSKTSPWLIKQPTVLISLVKWSKIETSTTVFMEKIYNILQKYINCKYIHQMSPKILLVGCSAILNKSAYMTSSIDLALGIITDCESFIIYLDSLSVLMSLKYENLTNPLITKLFNKINILCIIFCWIPNHPEKWKSKYVY